MLCLFLRQKELPSDVERRETDSSGIRDGSAFCLIGAALEFGDDALDDGVLIIDDLENTLPYLREPERKGVDSSLNPSRHEVYEAAGLVDDGALAVRTDIPIRRHANI